MTGVALTNALANGNVTIASTNGSGTDGNININDSVNWSANTLTLNATNNIYVNNVITATGTASLAANYGTGTNSNGTPMGLYTYQGTSANSFTGKINFNSTGTLKLDGEIYTVINTPDQLLAAASSGDTGGLYAMGSDMTFGYSYTWTTSLDNNSATGFTGKFNGLGHVLDSLSSTTTGVSMFGTIAKNARVSNLGLSNAYISANNRSNSGTSAGVLADINRGSIINSFAIGMLDVTDSTGTTPPIQSTGGLVGTNSGLIAQSYASVSIEAMNGVAGGLVGTNEKGGIIIDSSARSEGGQTIYNSPFGTPAITYVGGLVGENEGEIDRSYSNIQIKLSGATRNGVVDTTSIAGCFVGKNTGIINESYAATKQSGDYSTAPRLGGFVGENSGTIANAYSTALYMDKHLSTDANWSAGFAYRNTGTIKNAYSTAYSTNNTARCGFVCPNDDGSTGTIENAYWYALVGTDATTGATIGSTPTNTSAAKNLNDSTAAATFANYKGFDTAIWGASKSGYPILNNLLVYVSTLAPDNGVANTPVYGSATSDVTTLNLVALGLQGGGGLLSNMDSVVDSSTYIPFTATTNNGYVDAGTQNAANVLKSSTYSNITGTITVDPKKLLIVGIVANKTYDGTTATTLNAGVAKNGLVGLVGDQTLNITYSGATFVDKNAGISKKATITYTAANGTNGGKTSNYTISDTTWANITKKQISTSVTASDKTYDGITTASVSSYQLPGAVSGDDLSLNINSATFADKNAGTDKVVTVGATLTGADKDNYTLKYTTLQTTANIAPRPLLLAGAKLADGSASISSENLTVMNAVGGEPVGLSGTATLASATQGVQLITNLTALTVNNPNYTLVGSIGSVVVGGHNLVLNQVSSGTATVTTSGNTTTITQTTDKAVLDWQRFSIPKNETVEFVQPSTSSIVLNRVIGNEVSVIDGIMKANGRVFIINSNGVLFTANSTANVGGLIVSTLQLSNDNFNNSNYVFTANSTAGSVVAKGDIFIVDGGFIALASNNCVTQSGTISAPGGDALLVSADQLTLTLDSASTMTGYNIAGLNGATGVGGTINIVPKAGNGGLIETAGNSVTLIDNWKVKTGSNATWSLSLPSLSIGNGETFTAAFVNNNLEARNLSLNALGGDVNINGAVSWSSDTKLSLSAKNDININNAITATGENAGLAMNYGGDYNILTPATYSGAVLDANGKPVAQADTSGGVYGSITLSGANASLNINGNQYTLIHSMSQLDLIDKSDSVTGMYYNPKTGAYDSPVAPKTSTISNNIYYIFTDNKNVSWCYNPVTHKYDIPLTKVDINNKDVTYYYNPETRTYGLTEYSGNITNYYYNPVNGKYDIPCYSASNGYYYDPSTKTYHLDSQYAGENYYYVPTTGKYEKTDFDTSTAKYYDPATGGYTSTDSIYVSGYYFNPTTGIYDATSPYAVTGYYALANDLNASGAKYTTAPIISFSGTFAGLGHTISNLTISASDSGNAGLIGQASNSTIRDIGIVKAAVTGSGGILAAQVTDSTVSHAYSTGTLLASGAVSGGLIGSATNSTISDSYSDADASSGGGLIGSISNTTVSRCHATGDVLGGNGGLIDRGSGTITDSYATGIVGTETAYIAGGLVGSFSGSIVNSFATGNVTGRMYIGGLAASMSSRDNYTTTIVDNCYATGNVTATATSSNSEDGAGGLIGYVNNSASYSAFIINNSHATGNVAAGKYNDFAGGVVGYFSVNDSTSTGLISNSYSTSNVTSSSTNAGAYTGGIAGRLYGVNVSDSHTTGYVKGASHVGGIAGFMGGPDDNPVFLTNSYASGIVEGASSTAVVGGLIGDGRANMDNNYWNADSNSSAVGRGMKNPGNFNQGLTSEQFNDIGNYIDHTIVQVVTNRAAQQAAVQAAYEADANSLAGQTGGQAVQDQEDPSSLSTQVVEQRPTSVDDHIVYADSASYSADIDSIEADGIQYDLGDEHKKKKK